MNTLGMPSISRIRARRRDRPAEPSVAEIVGPATAALGRIAPPVTGRALTTLVAMCLIPHHYKLPYYRFRQWFSPNTPEPMQDSIYPDRRRRNHPVPAFGVTRRKPCFGVLPYPASAPVLPAPSLAPSPYVPLVICNAHSPHMFACRTVHDEDQPLDAEARTAAQEWYVCRQAQQGMCGGRSLRGLPPA
jgi:hypothetical protein